MRVMTGPGAGRVRGWRLRFAVVALGLSTVLGGCAAARTDGVAPILVDSSGAAASYLAGRFAFERGDYRTAAELFREALQADPNNLELARRLLRIELANGAFARARATARQLADLAPGLAEVRLVLALDAVREGRFVEGAERLAALPRAGTVGLVAPLLEAWARFAGEGPESGLARLAAEEGRALLERLYAYQRAVMLVLAGRLDAAQDLIAPRLADFEEEPLARQLVQLQAAIWQRSGEEERARTLIARQRELVPDDERLARLEERLAAGEPVPLPFSDAVGGMVEALVGIARAMREQDLREPAELFAALAALLREDADEAWLLLAGLATDRGDAEGALALVARIDEDSPLAWRARLLRAEALVEAGRKREAIALLRRMARERPDRVDALVALGDLYRRDENYREAERAYREALERIGEPRKPHWRLLYAHGITLERLDRWPEAEERFLQALAFVPDQPFVLNYLGYSWVDMGINLERAREMLELAVELRPHDGFIVDSLGWAYFRLGDFERAVELLERAVELEPGDPVINDHLGDAYWQVGRFREARFQWERALALDPDPELAESIRDKLTSGYADAGSDRG